ncbi:hypothetical protein [Sphingomonas sanxanigenens]|nr:hypothetical protein [Sphingomonas sanxanigenens]
MNIAVPWNASWSSEEHYEIRPCRWVGMRRAMWMPHTPGVGRPIFAKPHQVRQRRSIAEMRCTVCGEKTPEGDRWWFQLGEVREGWFMTTEAPVHRRCADFALTVCPHLRGQEDRLEPMPGGFRILSSLIGGPAVERDFGFTIRPGERVIGALKIAWKEKFMRRAV